MQACAELLKRQRENAVYTQKYALCCIVGLALSLGEHGAIFAPLADQR